MEINGTKWNNKNHYYSSNCTYQNYLLKETKWLLPYHMQSTVNPHLLLKVSCPDKQQLINLLSTGDVVLACHGRWCCFRYTILEKTENPGGLKLAIELVNSFLHHGQFYSGQYLQLFHSGMHIATAQVEEVLGPCLHYWDNLPFDASQKRLFPLHEIGPVISDWVTTLSTNTTGLVVDTTDTTAHHLVIKNVTHRTLLLTQAQQICNTLKDFPWRCCYKIAYMPPLYGLLELFLKEFSLTFILYNQTHFTKGVITVN